MKEDNTKKNNSEVFFENTSYEKTSKGKMSSRKVNSKKDLTSDASLEHQIEQLSKDLTSNNGVYVTLKDGTEMFVPDFTQEMLKYQILVAYVNHEIPITVVQTAIRQWFANESGVMTIKPAYGRMMPGKISEAGLFTPMDCVSGYIN